MKNFCKIQILILFILLSVSSHAMLVWNGKAEKWAYGSGTISDPYLIETPENLAYLSNMVNGEKAYSGVYFKQIHDFDMNGNKKNFIPIGCPPNKFSGIYDGNNCFIENVHIDCSKDLGAWALFGTVKGAVLKNIKLKDIRLTNFISSYYGMYIGGLIAHASNSTIIGCHCHSDISVLVESHIDVGALIGNAENCDIEKCSHVGDLILQRTYTGDAGIPYNYCLGGLIGQVENCTISSCCNIGLLRYANTSDYAAVTMGGLIGKVYSMSTSSNINDCYVILGFKQISTSYPITFGGIMARVSNPELEKDYNSVYKNCYAYIDTSYNNPAVYPICYYGGFGCNNTVINCYYNREYSSYVGEGNSMLTNDMKLESFVNTLNNGIGKNYEMDLEKINDGFPILSWQKTPNANITTICDSLAGFIVGGGSYLAGEQITLTAYARDGYKFVEWSDGIADNPRTITVNGNASYKALFYKKAYTIQLKQDCSIIIE